MSNIFVGNLSYQTTQRDLEAAFSAYGAVDSVSLMTDRDTGQPRGFAFVQMADSGAAQTAIEGLNGTDLHGRTLNVNEARPKVNSGGGGGGGFRKGGNSGGGNKSRQNRW